MGLVTIQHRFMNRLHLHPKHGRHHQEPPLQSLLHLGRPLGNSPVLPYGSNVGSLIWIGNALCCGTTQPSSFFARVLRDAIGCRYRHGIQSRTSRLHSAHFPSAQLKSWRHWSWLRSRCVSCCSIDGGGSILSLKNRTRKRLRKSKQRPLQWKIGSPEVPLLCSRGHLLHGGDLCPTVSLTGALTPSRHR